MRGIETLCRLPWESVFVCVRRMRFSGSGFNLACKVIREYFSPHSCYLGMKFRKGKVSHASSPWPGVLDDGDVLLIPTPLATTCKKESYLI